MVKVLGLAGRKGCGKTFLANYVCEKYPDLVLRLSFADPLKKMLSIILDDEDSPRIYGHLKEEPELSLLGGKSARYAMQTLGTEWGRNTIDSDIWVNCLRLKIINSQRILSKAPSLIIIDDVRFNNEVKMIEDIDGYLLSVLSSDTDIISKDSHSSEALDLTKFNSFINHKNAASTNDFLLTINKILFL